MVVQISFLKHKYHIDGYFISTSSITPYFDILSVFIRCMDPRDCLYKNCFVELMSVNVIYNLLVTSILK